MIDFLQIIDPRRLPLTFASTKQSVWFLAFCVGVCCDLGLNGSLCAQGNSKLSSNDAPWLDSMSGEVLPIDFAGRESARSLSRAEIPAARVVPPAAPAAPVAPARPWGISYWEWILGGFKVVGYVLLILVIGLVAYLVYRYYNRWRKMDSEENWDESLATRTVEQSMRQLSFDVDFSNGDFCDEAEKAYRSGDLRSAIIYLFSYVLVSLDQKGHIRLRKGKTNREYLREIRGQHGLAKFYQRVMVPFEETFFGDYQLEQEEFENCWSQLGQFQKDVVQAPRVSHG